MSSDHLKTLISELAYQDHVHNTDSLHLIQQVIGEQIASRSDDSEQEFVDHLTVALRDVRITSAKLDAEHTTALERFLLEAPALIAAQLY